MIANTQSYIQFILDGNVRTIDFENDGISPTLTVLNYLRDLPGHTGVKEGCAEGDCGACTVVVANVENNKLSYRAINSCLIFLPYLNGKELITIENLATPSPQGKKLHPVQQAIVDQNASQCGYCTPGIVLSVFALTKNESAPTKEKALDALTGNLCRCTGYQSILKAIEQLNDGYVDTFAYEQKATAELLKMIKQTSKSLAVNGSQKYFKPKTLKEALALRKAFPEALLANGSSDLALSQTKKFMTLPTIIDISELQEIQIFEESDSGWLLGAGLSLEFLKQKMEGKFPALDELLKVFASKQIREVATLGGNIGTASPIGDFLPLLMASHALIRLENGQRIRELDPEDFITAYRQTDLHSDELIHSIFIPKTNISQIKFYKVSKRKHLDISTVSAGFSIVLKSNKVVDLCLAFGGMAATPKHAAATENYLRGRIWNAPNIEQAGSILQGEFEPISDARADASFRSTAAKNLLTKFFIETTHE